VASLINISDGKGGKDTERHQLLYADGVLPTVTVSNSRKLRP